MATIINNPAIPPSPGFDPIPYQDITSESDAFLVVNVNGPEGQATLWLQSMIDNPYDGYTVNTYLSWDEGVISLPVADVPGTHAAIVRLHAGQGEKVVAWFGRRDGVKVQAPVQEDNTAVQVFAGESILLRSASLLADGVTWKYTLAGFYRYLLVRRVSPNVGDAVSFGQPPYALGSATENNFDPADLTAGITIPQT